MASLLKTAAIPAEDGLMRLPEVLRRIPVSRSTLYSKIRTGEWPAPVRVSKRVVAWKRSDVEALIGTFE